MDLPHLKEDILCRVELMTAKWDILQMKDKGTQPTEKKHVYEIGGVKHIVLEFTHCTYLYCTGTGIQADSAVPRKFVWELRRIK